MGRTCTTSGLPCPDTCCQRKPHTAMIFPLLRWTVQLDTTCTLQHPPSSHPNTFPLRSRRRRSRTTLRRHWKIFQRHTVCSRCQRACDLDVTTFLLDIQRTKLQCQETLPVRRTLRQGNLFHNSLLMPRSAFPCIGCRRYRRKCKCRRFRSQCHHDRGGSWVDQDDQSRPASLLDATLRKHFSRRVRWQCFRFR